MSSPRPCEFRDLGRIGYDEALAVQRDLEAARKAGAIPDQFLIVEHPHAITMGRNGHIENILASPEILDRAGISLHHTNRGGDVTYHGPGQIVGYPILDLREWKRDVVAYVRALEQVVMDVLNDFGICGTLEPGATGVWVDGRKVAAMGVHISRWVTSHGFALNHTTDLSFFQYIVPCGLAKPVTSMEELGCIASRGAVVESLARHFADRFQLELFQPVELTEII